MIHHVPNQLKFKRLVRLLRPLCGDSVVSPETVAVGVLERLWHATIANAIQGNVGKLSDEDIAEAVGWLGNASCLIDALVESRWLDRCEVHRLVIHDWHLNAPNFVAGNLKKHGREFAIATCPGQPAIAPLPNLTIPDLTELTEQTKPVQPISPVSQDFFKSRWEEIRDVAKDIHDRVDKNGVLTARNRQLVLKFVGMGMISPPASEVIERQVVKLAEKMASPNPAKSPWGWLKSRVITAMKESELSFDELWDAVEVPSELLTRKPAPQLP